MRAWIVIMFVLTCVSAFGQSQFEDLARESSRGLDLMGYQKPDFKWKMDGKAQASLNEGINLLDEEKPRLAITELSKASLLAPKEWIIYYYLGVAYKQTKSPQAAIRLLGTARGLNATNFYVDMEMGKCYEMLNMTTDAIRCYDNAASEQAKSPLPHYMKGNVYLGLRELQRAERSYREANKTDPSFLDGEVKIAQIEAVAKDRGDAAIKILADVLKKDSTHQQALIFHGLLGAKENPKSSLHDFDVLVRLNPGNAMMRLIRGLLRIETEDFEGAFADMRRVLEATSGNVRLYSGQQSQTDRRLDIEYAGFYVMSHIYSLPEDQAVKIKKAFCLMLVGSYEPALRAIHEIVDFPTSPLCTLLEAIANEHGGNHNKAYQLYERALYLDNDIPDAHKKRGIYRMELRDYVGAEKDFTEMLRLNSEDVVAYRFRGLTKFHRDRFVDAIADFDKYLAADSLERETLIARGMAYKKSGRVLEATADLLKGDDSRDAPPFDQVKGELDKLLAKGDTSKVISWLNKFIAGDRRNPKNYTYLVTLRLKSKDWDRAISESTAAIENGMVPSPYIGEKPISSYLPEVNSFFYYAIGTGLSRQNKPDAAMEALNRAIDLDKTNGKAYLERGKIFQSKGKTSSAEKDFAKAKKYGEGDDAR